MREILFRGKRVDNGEWIEGLLFYSHGLGTYKITASNGWIPSYNNPDEGESTIYYDINPTTVGQYIGLSDKRERKIFDGDRIHIWGGENYNGMFEYDYYGHVEFSCGEFYVNTDKMSISFGNIDNCEIIGNIHDKTKEE